MSFDPDRLDARDPALIAQLLPLVREFNRRYVRLDASGLEHLPQGPALLVANHNGGISGPDILCTLGTLWEHRGPHAPLYALAHDFVMRHATLVGRAIQPFGGLRAAPGNALRALRSGAQVLVYPGGDIEAFRHTARRNQIWWGARSGFVRVAQEAGVPIVPVVAHGAHRSALIVAEGKRLARALGVQRWARVERFPIALALPWGVALGPWLPYLPLPFQVKLRFLPPVHVAPDEALDATRERIRAQMQRALDDLTA